MVVIDTLRVDATGPGSDGGSATPHVDAVAARGLRYTRAYAPAPWTTPSHASLLSGLSPEHHRVGVSERITVGPDVVMLAERLQTAGYETAAFIENPLVGKPFGFDQGFDRFTARSLEQLLAEFQKPGSSGFDVAQAFTDWMGKRDRSRPFFAFVNLFEAHEPYRVRDENPFLPVGVTAADAARVRQSTSRICNAIPPPNELASLRGLYLGDVAAADATLGALTAQANAAGVTLYTVVTADHGEHLGERRLLDHQFTVDDVAVHVPLVVAGPGVTTGTVDAPVTLADVAASVLGWAGIADATPLDGRALPGPTDTVPPRDLLAAYADRTPTDWPLPGGVPGASAEQKRAHCGSDDRVRGDMAALIRFPWKLVWYAHYPLQLFDVSQDPGELTDLAGTEAARATELRAALAARIQESGLFVRTPDGAPDPHAVEALKALGYVE